MKQKENQWKEWREKKQTCWIQCEWFFHSSISLLLKGHVSGFTYFNKWTDGSDWGWDESCTDKLTNYTKELNMQVVKRTIWFWLFSCIIKCCNLWAKVDSVDTVVSFHRWEAGEGSRTSPYSWDSSWLVVFRGLWFLQLSHCQLAC